MRWLPLAFPSDPQYLLAVQPGEADQLQSRVKAGHHLANVSRDTRSISLRQIDAQCQRNLDLDQSYRESLRERSDRPVFS